MAVIRRRRCSLCLRVAPKEAPQARRMMAVLWRHKGVGSAAAAAAAAAAGGQPRVGWGWGCVGCGSCGTRHGARLFDVHLTLRPHIIVCIGPACGIGLGCNRCPAGSRRSRERPCLPTLLAQQLPFKVFCKRPYRTPHEAGRAPSPSGAYELPTCVTYVHLCAMLYTHTWLHGCMHGPL